eukprot:scaffold158356_cov32-Tisochrysis_lutea.AAC.1
MSSSNAKRSAVPPVLIRCLQITSWHGGSGAVVARGNIWPHILLVIGGLVFRVAWSRAGGIGGEGEAKWGWPVARLGGSRRPTHELLSRWGPSK